MTGTVKRVVRDRGFGFVRGEDGNERFFHRSGMAAGVDFDNLREGQRVTFVDESSPKGPRAAQINPA